MRKNTFEINTVCIYDCGMYEYPDFAPFHPSTSFPEYPFKNYISHRDNPIYDCVRNILCLLNLDKDNFGKNEWNPFGNFIKQGDNVVIKPNLVRNFHGKGLDITSIITHASLIRVVLDYVYIALQGQGTITIGDAPIQQANFDKLLALSGIDKIAEFYSGVSSIPLRIVDFRTERCIKNAQGLVTSRIKLNGDDLGYTAVDLGSESYLAEVSHRYKRFRVTNYNPMEMTKHHNETTNEYLISNSILKADVIINLPKLKTHRKAGITASLKNLVGINGSKDWLPHHTKNSTEEDGDEYLHRSLRKRIQSSLTEMIEKTNSRIASQILSNAKRAISISRRIVPYKDHYFEGSWYGNDTLWRMILDLNKIALFINQNGHLQKEQQRKYFVLVDAMAAGEGEGPMEPTPKECGLLIAGFNPVLVDLTCAKIMGFDYRKIAVLQNALSKGMLGIDEHSFDENYNIVSNDERWENVSRNVSDSIRFTPTMGWKGHIEIEE